MTTPSKSPRTDAFDEAIQVECEAMLAKGASISSIVKHASTKLMEFTRTLEIKLGEANHKLALSQQDFDLACFEKGKLELNVQELEQGIQRQADFDRETCMERDTLRHELELANAQIAVKDEVLNECESILKVTTMSDSFIRTVIHNALTNSPAAAKELLRELAELKNFKAGALKSMARHGKPTTDW